MITVTVKFDNKDKKAEGTTVSAKFKEFKDIQPWMDKVEALNDDKALKNEMGFLANNKPVKETEDGDSSS
jgi:hypothetical protein